MAKRRDNLEDYMLTAQKAADASLLHTLQTNPSELANEVNGYAQDWANTLMTDWKALGEYLVMKFNDQVVKKETRDGKWELTPDGICVAPERPGYPEQYRGILIRETGDKYLVPETK